MPRILGLSCSLRNARFGYGSDELVADLMKLGDEAALFEYLDQQTKMRADDFVEAGRKENLPFDQIYKNLNKHRAERGLSNSEAMLAAALWGAWNNGAEITHCGLSRYFTASGNTERLDELRQEILKSDGILISGPVYFGDRGSLAQELFEFLHNDPALREHVHGRLYAGLAVGAKRNGGQETNLVYQIVDATNMNMLAVGNDSDTTSQYGGTGHAGDVGTAAQDEYGIRTAIGTGRRIANVGAMLDSTEGVTLKDKVRISLWLLQDDNSGRGLEMAQSICQKIEQQDGQCEITIYDFTKEQIHRCIACDVCPVDVGPPDEYRCIITAKQDLFKRMHESLIETDAILLGAYSPIDRQNATSVYQRFIERTRYLRRDDYVLSDTLAAPFVISEVNANQNLHIRMMTSLVRHHTVLHHPLICFEKNGQLINDDFIINQGVEFARQARRLTLGRLQLDQSAIESRGYEPIGYQISREKRRQDVAHGRASSARTAAAKKHAEDQMKRIAHDK